MLKIDSLPSLIPLGYQGENRVWEIEIDCASWLERWPTGVLTATMTLPSSEEAQPLFSATHGDVMYITVGASMTAVDGVGSINIALKDDEGVIKKSALMGTLVRPSHSPVGGEIPTAVEDWLTLANEKVDGLVALEEAVEQAESQRELAEQARAEMALAEPQELSFDKTTCVLSISQGNQVELNRGLNNEQYNHLAQIMARPYGTWTLTTGPVYSQTHPSRDVPGRKSCRVEWGLGIIHLDFVAAVAEGIIGTIPATGPKAEILIEEQLHDGATVWIDQGARAIKTQGLQVGQRYLFNIIGFFVK